MRTTLICVVGLQIKSYTNSILQKAAAASATCRHSCLITHTLTLTHTLAHMPAICDALKLANICLPAFCCCFVFLPTRSWWRRPPFCCSSVACLVTASLALLSSPLLCVCLSLGCRLYMPATPAKKGRRQSAQAARVQATSATKATFKAQLSLNLLLD